MVSLRNIIAFVALAAPVISSATPGKVIYDINTITSLFETLQDAASKITVANGKITTYPKVLKILDAITSVGNEAVSEWTGTPPVGTISDSDSIFAAFTTSVQVQEGVYNTLSIKADLFKHAPKIGKPVTAYLKQLKIVLDGILVDLINTVLSHETEIETEGAVVDKSLTALINKYNALN